MSINKVWGKKATHFQKLAVNEKSIIFVLFSWNLVKMIAPWDDYFHQVSWGLDKNCGFSTNGQFLRVSGFFTQTLDNQVITTISFADDWFFLRICKKARLNFELDFSYVKTQIKFEEEKIEPNTFCRFLHHLNPYLKLGPFKEEQISVKPYSVIFKDIVNEKEMEYLKTTAMPQLSRNRDYGKDLAVQNNDGIQEIAMKLIKYLTQSCIDSRYLLRIH